MTKKILFFALAIFLASSTGINAATLSLSPSTGEHSVDEEFTVDILLNTESTATDGVDIHYLNFDATKLEAQSVTAGSLYSSTPVNTIDNTNGRIDFSQITSGGTTYNGSGTLATVTFKVIAEGSAPLSFSYTSGQTSDCNVASNGSDVLSSATGASFTTPNTTPDPYCGDGSCNNSETCSTCSADCGACTPPGGGGGGTTTQTNGTVAGKITLNSTSGNPVSGVSVVISPGKSATTAQDGTYTISDITPGTYSLTATKTGYLGYTQNSVTVSANQTTTVNLYIQLSSETSTGTLIKSSENPAVYYIGSDNKRYVFPNQKCYNTWYEDFSQVKVVTPAELASYQIGGNITYRPGTRLVKITTDPKVYAVEPGGILRSIASETQAKALYGDQWNKIIDDVPDAFFTNYSVGAALTENKHPVGSLIKYPNQSTIYYIDNTYNKRAITTEPAFTANRLNWSNIREISTSITYPDGTALTAEDTMVTFIK
jgi:hypothetical protein